MILELISKDYNMTTVASWELDKSRWINVIADLQLTEQQVGRAGLGRNSSSVTVKVGSMLTAGSLRMPSTVQAEWAAGRRRVTWRHGA